MIHLESASVVVPTAAGSVTILQPTTLQLTERRISIIGSNGSGKSTLARLFNGLIVPSSGTVRVGSTGSPGSQSSTGSPGSQSSTASPGTTNSDIAWFDTARHGAEVRRRVGFVFTDPSAQLVMPTAIEDVALSLRRTHKNKADRLAAAQHTLERFGLGELADRSVHSLSGGQRQLLALAAVLATAPATLVADEPTTLLDLRNSLRVHNLLRSLPQQVITVTHDLELAAQADRTLVVDRAQVVFDGPPAEAIAHYRQLVSAPEDTQSASGPGGQQ